MKAASLARSANGYYVEQNRDVFNMGRFPMSSAGAKKARRAAGRRGPGLEEEQAPFESVMDAAERSGLLKDKRSRISGRVSAALIEQAKRRTGIESDTDLIEFALANVALEDNFAEAFKAARGKIDPDLKLGF
jgi:hypothetical protein